MDPTLNNPGNPEASKAPPTPSTAAPETVAVIDIGATSIRMAIAEISHERAPKILESLAQTITIGKDTFSRGNIRRRTIEECVEVLVRYQRVLLEYGIDRPERIRVVATSAVREAGNRMAFIDRVYIATGLHVTPIDEAEENRITFLSVYPLLQAEPTLASSATIVVEIGGGSTDVLLVDSGNVLYAHTYRLGALRIQQMMSDHQTPADKLGELLDSQVAPIVKHVRGRQDRDSPVHLMALGGDIRFAVSRLFPNWKSNGLARLSVRDLEAFTQDVLASNDEELVTRLGLSLPDAETLSPALYAYVKLARAFNQDQLLVSSTNLRDGLIKEIATSETWAAEFSNQIIRSALHMGRRFHVDETHTRHVAELSTTLFDQLQSEHRLDFRFRTLLYVAGLLYEVGLFVDSQSHHKHSLYLIRNSEIFGLSKRDLLLVGLIVRYHRRATPQGRHELYMSLDREQRTTVSKLAAILRVAIALDQSRSQRIHEIRCVQKPNKLIIMARDCRDVSLEQLSLNQSSDLFEDVYGKKILLRGIHPE